MSTTGQDDFLVVPLTDRTIDLLLELLEFQLLEREMVILALVVLESLGGDATVDETLAFS